MKKIILSSVLAFSLSVVGCGGSSSTPKEIKSTSLSLELTDIGNGTVMSDTDIIVTDKSKVKVDLVGEYGSKVFINGKEYASFDDSGKMVVELEIDHLGSSIFKVKSISSDGIESDMIVLEVIRKDVSSSLGVVHTKGEASALTVSQSGTVFIAEKNSGVEIISIGFNDRVSSDLLSTISGFTAVNVLLSDDEKELYIKDEDGKYHVMDISDISNPVEIGLLNKVKKFKSALSSDNSKRYRISSCGLIGEDISDVYNSKYDFIIKDEEIKDVVLVDEDTKLLVAHGEDGLVLYSLDDEKNPQIIGQKNLHANTSGLSLIKRDGILFVANGESGVEIFNLDILLHEMKK